MVDPAPNLPVIPVLGNGGVRPMFVGGFNPSLSPHVPLVRSPAMPLSSSLHPSHLMVSTRPKPGSGSVAIATAQHRRLVAAAAAVASVVGTPKRNSNPLLVPSIAFPQLHPGVASSSLPPTILVSTSRLPLVTTRPGGAGRGGEGGEVGEGGGDICLDLSKRTLVSISMDNGRKEGVNVIANHLTNSMTSWSSNGVVKNEVSHANNHNVIISDNHGKILPMNFSALNEQPGLSTMPSSATSSQQHYQQQQEAALLHVRQYLNSLSYMQAAQALMPPYFRGAPSMVNGHSNSPLISNLSSSNHSLTCPMLPNVAPEVTATGVATTSITSTTNNNINSNINNINDNNNNGNNNNHDININISNINYYNNSKNPSHFKDEDVTRSAHVEGLSLAAPPQIPQILGPGFSVNGIGIPSHCNGLPTNVLTHFLAAQYGSAMAAAAAAAASGFSGGGGGPDTLPWEALEHRANGKGDRNLGERGGKTGLGKRGGEVGEGECLNGGNVPTESACKQAAKGKKVGHVARDPSLYELTRLWSLGMPLPPPRPVHDREEEEVGGEGEEAEDEEESEQEEGEENDEGGEYGDDDKDQTQQRGTYAKANGGNMDFGIFEIQIDESGSKTSRFRSTHDFLARGFKGCPLKDLKRMESEFVASVSSAGGVSEEEGEEGDEREGLTHMDSSRSGEENGEEGGGKGGERGGEKSGGKSGKKVESEKNQSLKRGQKDERRGYSKEVGKKRRVGDVSGGDSQTIESKKSKRQLKRRKIGGWRQFLIRGARKDTDRWRVRLEQGWNLESTAPRLKVEEGGGGKVNERREDEDEGDVKEGKRDADRASNDKEKLEGTSDMEEKDKMEVNGKMEENHKIEERDKKENKELQVELSGETIWNKLTSKEFVDTAMDLRIQWRRTRDLNRQAAARKSASAVQRIAALMVASQRVAAKDAEIEAATAAAAVAAAAATATAAAAAAASQNNLCSLAGCRSSDPLRLPSHVHAHTLCHPSFRTASETRRREFGRQEEDPSRTDIGSEMLRIMYLDSIAND